MPTTPEFRAIRCVRYRYRYSQCRRCADACPHEAIAVSDDGLRIDGVRCQNCALCASACRTEALAAGNLVPIDLLKQAAKQERFAFACAPSDAEGDAVVPCLGALSPGMLAYLARRGIAVELRGSGHCSQCRHAPRGADQLALNLEGLGLLRQAAGGEQWADVALAGRGKSETKENRPRHDVSRRQLFRRFIGWGVDQAAGPGASPDRPVPLRAIRAAVPVQSAQRELLQALWQTAGDALALRPHPVLPLAQLRVEPGCTACEACARVCPTGALQLKESNSVWALTFRFSRCVGCEVCLEACQPRVLRSLDVMAGSALREDQCVTLHSVPKKRCDRCSRVFVSAEPTDVCPVCRADDDDFASIFG